MLQNTCEKIQAEPFFGGGGGGANILLFILIILEGRRETRQKCSYHLLMRRNPARMKTHLINTLFVSSRPL